MERPESTSSLPPTGEVARLAEHLFREEAGKLVSILTRAFGIDHLDLVEDVVQEAMARALRIWPYYGVPKNPAAWLHQTAKHLAIDFIRREKRFLEKQSDIIASVNLWSATPLAEPSPQFEGEIRDNALRLMFACCHPQVHQEAQTALALKTLCGFGTGEIARAFLTTEAAIAKRLTRAKQRIRELALPFEIPCGEELSSRLDAVLQTLYLLFNEGYSASRGDYLIKEPLCNEAIRLASLIAEHPQGNQPITHALLALMLLTGARLPARMDADGNLLRLKDQDRSLWNREMIFRGMMHLNRSAAGEILSVYHLQSGIAACHVMAQKYESTDWPRILSLYDQWAKLDPSPIVALNRAVALAEVHGPEFGMASVEAIQNSAALGSYYLLYAVIAEFEFQRENFQSAANHLRQAIELTEIPSEKEFLTNRLRLCIESTTPGSPKVPIVVGEKVRNG